MDRSPPDLAIPPFPSTGSELSCRARHPKSSCRRRPPASGTSEDLPLERSIPSAVLTVASVRAHLARPSRLHAPVRLTRLRDRRGPAQLAASAPRSEPRLGPAASSLSTERAWPAKSSESVRSVRIRSTTIARLRHGSVLLPSEISGKMNISLDTTTIIAMLVVSLLSLCLATYHLFVKPSKMS